MTGDLELDGDVNYQQFRARWRHVALPGHVDGALREDLYLRCDVVDAALTGLDATPRLRQRFLDVLDRELGRGVSHGRAAYTALMAVERAAIARRALRDIEKERRSP